MESPYFDRETIEAVIADGSWRGVVGGMWDEIGPLQLDFLRQQGLRPEHRLLDIGCGCLRGGVHFVRYLDAGNYFGVDMHAELLRIGREVELGELQAKLPPENLICTAEFDFSGFPGGFDYALAQSVFTHLNFNSLRLCLERAARVVKPGGVLYLTFNELPEGEPFGEPFRKETAITCGTADPYHYYRADLVHAAHGTEWEPRYIGQWGHPRDQRMMAYRLPS